MEVSIKIIVVYFIVVGKQPSNVCSHGKNKTLDGNEDNEGGDAISF